MTSSSCVLCAMNIVKNCDKNLVVGRKNTVFNVREEILSLECEVVINTDYICRNCLAILKKRRALLTNLREVNKTIRKITSSKISSLPANITPVPYSGALLESDLQEQSSKRVALEDLRRSEPRDRDACTTSVERFPVITSTPRKEKGPVALPAVPVSPIVARKVDEDNASAKKTRVQVTVEWPSRTKVNTLHEGLESLGKMLCRGTYKQIAGAVWKNAILRKHVQQLFLRDVDRECTALCSLKNPSCLRSPNKKDLHSFSIAKFNNELETRAPLFSAVLWTASVRKSKREDAFWQPSVYMSAAVLLKNRSPCMNAMQLLNTVILYHTGIIVSNFFVSNILLLFIGIVSFRVSTH